MVIEKPPTPLPNLPRDAGEVPPIKQAVTEKTPLEDSSSDDLQKADAVDLKESIDISHKFEDLFENDGIFSEIEDLDNFEIIIREVPENFAGIKDVLKTPPMSSLTVPALAEKFMTDLENKEKDFKEESITNPEDVQIIDLSKLDLFNDFIEQSGVTENTKKDKRNPLILIVCIWLGVTE